MSRQLEIKTEERETQRRAQLVKVLDFGLVGALETQGIEMLGFAFKYDAFNCLMTLKAVIGGEYSVCFIGSDTVINCILKAYSAATSDALKWRADQYHT